MKLKQITATLLVITLLFCSCAVFAEEENATRGEVVQMLITAADDYNPTVQKSDIIKGYEDGELHEDLPVTRAEALVMLKRAFGTLPELTGHNLRVAIPTENFTDIPDWADEELSAVFDAGIVAGTDEGIFSPDDPVTTEQMELFIKRVYALFGSNEKDDFYAAVNKETLETLEIKPGHTSAGTLVDLSDKSTEEVAEIINDVISNTHENGTKEQKISDLYDSIMDMDTRNSEGIKPIQKYLDMINSAQNIDDLISVQSTMFDELCFAPFMAFSFMVDMMDSTKYILYFDTLSPMLTKEFYTNGTAEQTEAYLKYIRTLYMLGGESEADAENMSQQFFNFEKILSEASLNEEDYNNVNKVYNVFTMQEIKDMFPNVDMDIVFSDSGLKPDDNIMVADVGLTEAFAQYFNDENIDTLKSYAKLSLLIGLGGALNQEFTDAENQFDEDFMGVTGSYTDEERAVMMLQQLMPDYIGELYAEKYFSEEAKQDIEKMVQDIIAVYKERLMNNTWMSDTTKQKAINKLDTMGIKIGYPDSWETYLDNAEIKSVEDGGSYFTNLLNIYKAAQQEYITLQDKPVDKTKWIMYPYTVNACYSPTSNDITFPAAILQAPFYDVNASYEQNLGGIGFVIAHEITHAFDNNGAKFDENGNAADWWEEEDYEVFQELCSKMVEFYDGQEGIPGIPINGTLTLGENVADQGAAACITEIVSRLDNPDFQTMYRNMANCWASTATREYYQYNSQINLHSTEKLRVNRVVVNCDEFYKAFDINEGDGMYVAPENRIKIW